jgi:hypothetical protein
MEGLRGLRQLPRAARLAAIDELPSDMADHALVEWETVAAVLAKKDVQEARRLVREAGLPLVQISSRRALPRWRDLRTFIESRTINAPEAA